VGGGEIHEDARSSAGEGDEISTPVSERGTKLSSVKRPRQEGDEEAEGPLPGDSRNKTHQLHSFYRKIEKAWCCARGKEIYGKGLLLPVGRTREKNDADQRSAETSVPKGDREKVLS